MTSRVLSIPLMLLVTFGFGCSHLRTVDTARTIDGEQPSAALYLPENVESWAARWDIISKAEHSIDLTYFIVQKDIFGMSLLGLLHHKAKQGVKVRLMLDSRGSILLSRSGFGADILQELLLTNNAEVRIYNPLERQLPWALSRGMRTVVASNHDKILVVDKKVAIIGGRNISRDYLASHDDHSGAWFDADVLIGGGAVKDVQQAFDDEYNAYKTMTLANEIFNLIDRSQNSNGPIV